MDTPLDHVALYDAPHIADPLRGLAIRTEAGLDTGVVEAKTDGIDRGRIVFDTGHRRIQIRGHLVHPHHEYDLLGPKYHSGHPISHAVQVHQFPV